MLGSSILDVAIGMAFVFLLLSLIASTVQEALAALVQSRAANLERGIRSLFSGGTLDGKSMVDLIYTHGLVRGLYQDPKLDNPHELEQYFFPAWLRKLFHRSNAAAANAAPATAPAKSSPARALVRWFLRIKANPPMEGISDPFLLPAYIPARTFSIALIDLLGRDEPQGAAIPNSPLPPGISKNAATLDVIEKRLRDLLDDSASNKSAAEAMLALLSNARSVKNAEDAAEKFRVNLENWYNDAMDRVSGWYKKYTQKILIVIGLLLAIIFNVDSIRVAQTLWFDHDARQGLVNAAGNYVAKNPLQATAPVADGSTTAPPVASPVDQETYQKNLAANMETTVKAFNDVSSKYLLPVGWRYSRADYRAILSRYTLSNIRDWDLLHPFVQLLGWVITAFALSLGAPFWFDTLNKFMVVRSTVKPQEKSANEGSKD